MTLWVCRSSEQMVGKKRHATAALMLQLTDVLITSRGRHLVSEIRCGVANPPRSEESQIASNTYLQ